MPSSSAFARPAAVLFASLASLASLLVSLVACNGHTEADFPDASNGGADGGGSLDAGSTEDAGENGRDAGGGASDDAGDDAGCPGVMPIPVSPIYECQPTATAATGCPPFQGNADGGLWYPFGCNVALPEPQGGCAGSCCGPQICTCQSAPFPAGTGFLCPI